MTFNSNITDLTGYCIMAKTSFSFCPLLLCSSSPRDIKFQYEEKRNSCIFGLANFFRPSATSRGSISSSVLLIVPQCASPFTCTQLSTRQNKLHGSRRTQHCKPPATPTLHYTQHYTLHYTQHCRNAARGSISGQDRKIVLYFHIIP